MTLKVDITDEAVVTALNAIGEVVVKKTKELFEACPKTDSDSVEYVILRNGKEVTDEELKKERGEQHTPAKYELKITIKT